MPLMTACDWIWPSGTGLDPGDRGLAYGDGLFETLLMGETGPVLLPAHLARLKKGADLLGIPCSRKMLSGWWDETAARWSRSGRRVGLIKVIWTRGSGGRGYRPPENARPRVLTSFHPPPPPPPADGVSAVLGPSIPDAGPLAGFKTLSRLDQVLAAKAMPRGCFESIMRDSLGRPLEGSRSNLFLATDEGLVTPPVHRLAVAGVMRAFLLNTLPEIGIPVFESPLSWQQVRGARGLMLTNSIFGIAAVGSVGCLQLPLDGRIAKIRRLLEQEFGFHFID